MSTVASERFMPRTRVHWALAVPVLLYTLVVFPYLFRDVLGEPDLERMALGLMYGSASGLHAAAGYHYNYLVSFGYYEALYALLPPAVLSSSAALIAVINTLGFVSALVAVGMLSLYLARLFGALPALLACLLFAFSPVYLDLGTSGHPQLPGFALLLIAAWLLTYVDDPRVVPRARVIAALSALVVSLAAMTVRADVALAFPFITLMGRQGSLALKPEWLRGAVLRLVVLGVACALWLALVMMVAGHGDAQSGGYVGSFFAQFYKLRTVPRGLIVFCLCMGVATVLAGAILLCSRAARGLSRVDSVALALLALPTLLFWSEFHARKALAAGLSGPGHPLCATSCAVRACVTRYSCRLVAGPRNQAIAEISHDPIVRHYDWVYPLLTARRATNSVPIGAFPLDHNAKQQLDSLLREEGLAFARACSGRVLVISEEPYFMLMSLIERDPTVRLSTSEVGANRVYSATGARCTADFVEKQAPLHRDPLPELLQSPRYAGWLVYFQEARRNASDRTAVPVERRFCLAPAGRCAAH